MASFDMILDASKVTLDFGTCDPLVTSALWGSEFASSVASDEKSDFGGSDENTNPFGCSPCGNFSNYMRSAANPMTPFKKCAIEDALFSKKTDKKRARQQRLRAAKSARKAEAAAKAAKSKSNSGDKTDEKSTGLPKPKPSGNGGPKGKPEKQGKGGSQSETKKPKAKGKKAPKPQVPKGSLKGDGVVKPMPGSKPQDKKKTKSSVNKGAQVPVIGKPGHSKSSGANPATSPKPVDFEQLRLDLSRPSCDVDLHSTLPTYYSNYRLTKAEYTYAQTIVPNVVPGTVPHDHALAATIRGYCQQMCERLAIDIGKQETDEPRIADFFGCKRIDHEGKHVFMPNITARDAGRHKPELASWCECIDYKTCTHHGGLDVGICVDAVYNLDWDMLVQMCSVVTTNTVFIAYHPMDSKSGATMCDTYKWETDEDMVRVECGTGDLREVYEHKHPNWFSSWMGKAHSVRSGVVMKVSHRRAIGPMRIAMIQMTGGKADTYIGKPTEFVNKVIGRNAFFNNLYSHEDQCIESARHPFINAHDSELYEKAVIAASTHARSVLCTRSLAAELCPHGIVFCENFARYTDKACTQLLGMPTSALTIEDGRPADYNIVHVSIDMTSSLEIYFKRECVFFDGRIAVFGPADADIEIEEVERNLVVEHNGPLMKCTLSDRVNHFGWATIKKPFIRILSGDLLRAIAVDAITHTHSKETGNISTRLLGSVRRMIKKCTVDQDLLAIDAELYMRVGLIRVMSQSSRAFRSTEKNLPTGEDFALLGTSTYQRTFYERLCNFASDLKGAFCLFSCKSQRNVEEDPLVVPYGRGDKPFYDINGRCAKDIKIENIDSGAGLFERDAGPCCEALSTAIAKVYGPVISPSILTGPIGCTHDCRAALTNRQLRDPGLPINARAFKKAYDFIMQDDIFFALFGADEHQPITPLTYDELEASSTWGAGVRKDRRAAFEEWRTMGEEEANSKVVLNRKAFCKIEISVKTPAMLDETPLAPRCVTGGTDYYQSVLGRYTKAAANHVKKGPLSGIRDGVPTLFAYGMVPPTQITTVFSDWEECDEFAEADYSKFDAHQMKELLDFEVDVYERMFGINMDPRDLALLRTQLSSKGIFVGKSCGAEQAIWEYFHDGKRRSGDPNTSIGNSIVNIFCLIHWLLCNYSQNVVRSWILISSPVHFMVGGDDVAIAGTSDILNKLSQTTNKLSQVGMRLDFVLRSCLADMTFFQRNYYKLEDGTLRGIPKPGRILAKTFASTTPPASIEDADYAVHVLSNNFANDYHGFPVLGKLFAHLASITRPKAKKTRGSQLLLDHQRLIKIGLRDYQDVADRTRSVPSAESISHFKEKYQLSEADIVALEKGIKLIDTPRVFLDHPLWHRFLIGDEVLAAEECLGTPFGHDAWQ
jgi:hypothetical protein